MTKLLKTPASKRKPTPSAVAPCYAVRFRLQIHSCVATASSADIFMERIVTMPIPPAAGMEVSEGDWSATVAQIYVNLDAKHPIQAFVEADKEIYNALLQRRPHRPLSEIAADYEKSGWRVIRQA